VWSSNARAVYDGQAAPELRAMAERLTEAEPLYPIAAAAVNTQLPLRPINVRAIGDAALADFKRQFTAGAAVTEPEAGAAARRLNQRPSNNNMPVVWTAADDHALVALDAHRQKDAEKCPECGDGHAHVTITDAFPSHPDGGARRRERRRHLAWSLMGAEAAAPLRGPRLIDGHPMSRL
jgi:hypothetical protein